jgi:transcriptional antiterminator NusG
MPGNHQGPTVKTMNDEQQIENTEPTRPARGKWYVVNTLSGHEQKARSGLQARVNSMGLQDRIHEVLIPMQQVTEFKKGKKETVERKLYPGYLLVRCDLDDETWLAIRHTPGISGFAGQNQRSQQPTALSAKEAERIIGKAEEAPKIAPRPETYTAGDAVRVTNGPFADFLGTVTETLPEQNRVKISLDIFGRETLVELDFDQIRRP